LIKEGGRREMGGEMMMMMVIGEGGKGGWKQNKGGSIPVAATWKICALRAVA